MKLLKTIQAHNWKKENNSRTQNEASVNFLIIRGYLFKQNALKKSSIEECIVVTTVANFNDFSFITSPALDKSKVYKFDISLVYMKVKA